MLGPDADTPNTLTCHLHEDKAKQFVRWVLCTSWNRRFEEAVIKPLMAFEMWLPTAPRVTVSDTAKHSLLSTYFSEAEFHENSPKSLAIVNQ